MVNPIRPEPAVIAIFGAGGDLTWRKLIPALYDLFIEGWLPEQLSIIGLDLKKMSDAAFQKHLFEGVQQFARHKPTKPKWRTFAADIHFLSGDFTHATLYAALSKSLSEQDKAWAITANKVFYLAVSPSLIAPIVQHLGKAKLSRDRERERAVIEKPFGHDLDSAKALNHKLTTIFAEEQIYRIDHYLGKETVQNILAFRFANAFFEPIWDRRYIDYVQITVAEQVGVEHRGGYYDHAGALRDMIQNHLLQILCMVAMEPPVAFNANEIRNKKVDTLQAIRRIAPDEVHEVAVRGQYDKGWVEGEEVAAYRAEPDVEPQSSTETFAALKLFIDNWRWQDVPFYLRTGKRLPVRASEVMIHFRRVPHQSFPTSATEAWRANHLALRIQPQEGITLRFQAKQPGQGIHLSPVDMRFTYEQAFGSASPDAYENLLLDVLMGDPTLFMRADQVEAAWSVIMPVLEMWESVPAIDFPNYAANTWGPEAAEALIARDGFSWEPIILAPENEK